MFLRWHSICCAMMIAAILMTSAFGQVEVTQLSPVATFSINPAASAKVWKIREMRSRGSEVWILGQSSDGSYSLINKSPRHDAPVLHGLPSGSRATGLAVTDHAVAVILTKGGHTTLGQYDLSGGLISETPLTCSMAGSLLAVGQSIAVACADGTIKKFSKSGAAGSHSTWVRAGSLIEAVSEDRLAIIDQVTGQILLNDLRGGIFSLAVRAPEMEEAHNLNSAAQKQVSPHAQPLVNQRQLLVMDSASNSHGLYLLVWPYDPSEGAAILRVSLSGKVEARYRCKLPNAHSDPIHQIEATSQSLLLGSVAGNVYRFNVY